MEKAGLFPGRNVGYPSQLVAFLFTSIKPCGRGKFKVFCGRWVIPCGAEKAAKGGRALFPSRGEVYRGMVLVRGVRKSHFPSEREGAHPCSSVLSPSHFLQHHPKVASRTPNHHPTPSISSLVLPSSLAAGWERGGHRKPPDLSPSAQGPAKPQDHTLTSVYRVCSGQEQQQQAQSCPHGGAGSPPLAGKRHRQSHPGVFMEAVSAAGRMINPRGQASLACRLQPGCQRLRNPNGFNH